MFPMQIHFQHNRLQHFHIIEVVGTIPAIVMMSNYDAEQRKTWDLRKLRYISKISKLHRIIV